MKPARKRKAVEFGRALILEQARHKPRHSAQKTHDLMKAKGLTPLDVRQIQRHQAGDNLPSFATLVMYAEVYPQLKRFTE